MRLFPWMRLIDPATGEAFQIGTEIRILFGIPINR
jgi:hypothetical protein